MDYSKHLLTNKQMHDKYRALSNKEFKYPYVYRISKGDNNFVFVGSRHSYDSNDKQFATIIECWKDFLHASNGRKIVLVEGGLRKVQENQKLSIEKDGEIGLVAFLAKQNRVPYDSPEPTITALTCELLKKFTKDEIVFDEFVVVSLQWNKLPKNNRPLLRKYMEIYMNKFQSEVKWESFDFSYDNLTKLYEHQSKKEFSETDSDSFHEYSIPHNGNVSGESSKIRNNCLLTKILELWKNDNSIFAIYGSGHAIVLEPTLKKLLT